MIDPINELPSVIRQPAVIAQYPTGEEPEDLSKETGIPGAPMPPVRNAADIWKKAREESRKQDFPLKLTMEEYNRDWKPKGWKIIFIGPTATWRTEWGTWEAIREIIQNALDESESYQSGIDELGMFIKDAGRGIAVSDFLLGPSKLKPDYARGKYGEGMKIGALALVRQGYPVHVQTGDRELYIIFLEQEADGKVETLAALWKESPRQSGTTWHIIGYKEDLFDDMFAVNLPKSQIIASAPSQIKIPVPRYNQLISLKNWEKNPESAMIFARDIFMQNITSPFSYNLWDFELAPDRHAPAGETRMWEDVGRVWCCVKDKGYLKLFLEMVTNPATLDTSESHLVRLSYLGSDFNGKRYEDYIKENKVVWQKAWEETFGDDAVIKTNDRWDPTVKHLGYKPINIEWAVRDYLSYVILTDKGLIAQSQDKLREVKAVPDQSLTPTQLASLKLARAITDELYFSSPPGGISGAIIPPASDRVRTAGLYSRTTQEIFIAVDQLNHGVSTIDTLVHELAHHSSEAEDGIPAHYEEISRLAGIVVRNVSNKHYDSLIADPNFKWS